MKTILLCGGGTAGHIMPHIAIYPYLKKNFDNIYYVGSGKNIEQKLMKSIGVKVFAISAPKLKRSLSPDNLLIPFLLMASIKQAKELLESIKPSVVFSKGGYCALPVCIAAAKLNIPYVCHESDISLGLANRLTLSGCSSLITCFETTANKYGGLHLGAPMREEIFIYDRQKALRELGMSGNKKILLVIGGSQGSKAINNAVAKHIDYLTDKFDVIHSLGSANKPVGENIKGYYPFTFCDMAKCLAVCDYCISRAGSNTMFELLHKGIPTLAVPLKKGSRGDQIKNAKYFAQRGMAEMCFEEELENNLPALLSNLVSNANNIKQNIRKNGVKNGCFEIAKILTDVAAQKIIKA